MKATLRFILLLFAGLVVSTSGFGQVRIHFFVTIDGLDIYEGGVHIAGEFATIGALSITQDWEPAAAGSKMSPLPGNRYEVAVDFPSSAVGQLLRFQFVRDSVWLNDHGDISEGNPGDCCLDLSCAVGSSSGQFDRIITIPTCGGTYDCLWNTCTDLVPSTGPTLIVTPSNVEICPFMQGPIPLLAISNGTVSWTPDPTLSCTNCTNPLATPGGAKVYYVKSVFGNCTTTDSVVFTLAHLDIHLPPDTQICIGQSVTMTVNGGPQIYWTPAIGLSCSQCTTTIATPKVTTTYVVRQIFDECGLEDTLLIVVSNPPTLQVSPKTDTICKGETSTLLAVSNGALTWTPGSTLSCQQCPNPVASPLEKTTYKASARIGGCIVADSVVITPHVLNLKLPPDTTICRGSSIPLFTESNGNMNWSPATKLSCVTCLEPIASPLNEVLYTAVSSFGNCVLRDSVRIGVDSIKPNAGPDVTIFYGQSTQLRAAGGVSYIWEPGASLSCTDCPDPMAKPEETTTYLVRAPVAGACKPVDSVTVFVNNDCRSVFIPNLLTINQDEKNDQFSLASISNNGCRLRFEKLEMYNRWGKPVFETSESGFTWPGNDVASGVYFFRIQFLEMNFTGWMQVLK